VVPLPIWHHDDRWTPDSAGIRARILSVDDRLPSKPPLMRSLTRSRSPEFHRATMMRLLIAGTLLWVFWEPIRPIRTVTAQALDTAADIITR